MTKYGSSFDVGGSPSVSSQSQRQLLPESVEKSRPKVVLITIAVDDAGENRIWLEAGNRPLASAFGPAQSTAAHAAAPSIARRTLQA